MFQFLRIPLALAIVGITFISAGIYFTILRNNKEDIKVTQELTASPSAQIIVHIAGAVVNPGVYTLNSQARFYELIEKAGGLAGDANSDYIDKNINFAQVLKDSQKFYLPKIGEEVSGAAIGQSTANSLININTASKGELESLIDIGPVRAENIINSRPYGKIDELVEKKIISGSVFEKIKQKISV